MKSPIDFALLCDRTEGYAVHCTTEEDAAMFVEWARRLYPNRTSNWNDGETNFDSHGDKTVYTFNRKHGDSWAKSNLLFGDIRRVIDIGYTIIEFDEIHKHEDLVESDKVLDFLLT